MNLVVKANQSLSLIKGTPKNIKKLVGSLKCWWYIFGGVLKKWDNLYLIVFSDSQSLLICRNKNLQISHFFTEKV